MARWPTQHERSRRWRERSPYQVGRSWYRIRQGIKTKDDLVLERREGGYWVKVYMEEVFMAADFFHENEQWLEQEREYWRRGGGDYFLDQLRDAAKDGYQAPSERIRRQRPRA